MPLLMRCADQGRSVVLFDVNGRFKARVQGRQTGNVLLRKAHYDVATSPDRALGFAIRTLAAKLQNTRQVLMRAARDARDASAREKLSLAAAIHAEAIDDLRVVETMDEARGVEGNAAQAYFEAFDQAYFEAFDEMITSQRTDFRFDVRSRRPPRDRMNALLSFLYSMLTHDCVSALEGVGLDPQFGMLHVLRPGRPALALDLVEEFRATVGDRLALALVNRKQITAEHFDVRTGESVLLNEAGRKAVLVAYQKRKQELVEHPLFKDKTPVGLLWHLQARIMARAMRGDLEHYRPYMV